MTDVELLKMQVEALEKLVKIKDDTISELQNQLTLSRTHNIQYLPWPQVINIPSVWQVPQVTCQHEYPSLWAGTGLLSCLKCGQPKGGTITVTGITGCAVQANN